MAQSFYKMILPVIIVICCGLLPKASSTECHHEIVESMPEKLVFNGTLGFQPKATHEALIEMIAKSSKTIRVASFYWTLTAEPEFASHPSAEPGRLIMAAIETAVKSRNVTLEVVLDNSGKRSMNNPDDIKKLESLGIVKFLNMSKLLGAGVLHTKFMITDNQTLYMGSSNFDWRSYSQIKEIGIMFDSCHVLAQDLDKIFRTYMLISDLDEVPMALPEDLKTTINIDNPLNITLGGLDARLFLASSPPTFNGRHEWTGRTDDIVGLLTVINKARKHIDISVMNYSPRTEFIWPKKFWPKIDNALRRAASERRVRVRLLFSDWSHAKEEEIMWYKSLNAVQSPTLKGGGIHVKMFKVPAFDDFQKTIPYARVKHDKYMVTDNSLYIGTSNWAPDYFINTCGVSVVIWPQASQRSLDSHVSGSIIGNMRELFERDFSSEYSHEL